MIASKPLNMINDHYDDHGSMIKDELHVKNDKTSCDMIAPVLMKSRMNFPHMSKFRCSLTVGSKCDNVDNVHKWYVSTIMQHNVETNAVLIRNDGWKSKYDEWFPRDSPRIQPPYTVAKGGKETGGVPGQWTDLEPVIEDEEDPDNVCAVWRVELHFRMRMLTRA